MNTLTASVKRREFSAILLWTALILMFFVLQAILWTTAITLTAGDKSHTVVAGYDEQALNWDEVKQQKVESDKLGWVAGITLKTESDIRGIREVFLELKDRDGSPIENADVKISAYHRARAADKQEVVLKSVAAGIYSGQVKVQHSGKWRFTGVAILGEDRFLIEHQTELQSNRSH